MLVKLIKSAEFFRALMGIWVYFGFWGLFLVFEVATVGILGNLWNILIFCVIFFGGMFFLLLFFCKFGLFKFIYVVIEELFSIFWGIFGSF